MPFGARLRNARLSAGLSQEAVALELRVSQPTVSAWECGKAFPTLGRIRLIADRFDLDAGELLAEVVDEVTEEEVA